MLPEYKKCNTCGKLVEASNYTVKRESGRKPRLSSSCRPCDRVRLYGYWRKRQLANKKKKTRKKTKASNDLPIGTQPQLTDNIKSSG